MAVMTDENIEDGLSRLDAETQKGAEREDEFDFERRARHKPFKTQRPNDKEEALDDTEEHEPRPGSSRLKRTIIFISAFVIFLGVIIIALTYFLRSRGDNTLQVGSTDAAAASSRSQEDQKRSDDALKAVTETASQPPKKSETKAPGDTSQTVGPDPVAATQYPPTSVNPYSTSTKTADTDTRSPSTPSTTTTTSPQTPLQTITNPVEREADTSRGISYYLFRQETVPTKQEAQKDEKTSLPMDTATSSIIPAERSARESERSPIKPTFGALLPVRLLDSVVTLREGNIVRLETTRALAGAGGWQLPRGTTIVAHSVGGNQNRAYLSVVGFIDAQSNRLVTISGEVKGADGAMGIRGERKRVNSRWSQAVKELGKASISLGSAFLIGRRGGGGYYPPQSQIQTSGANTSSGATANMDFIYVRAGATAYVLITELPKAVEGSDAESLSASDDLTDDELAHLLTDGTPEQIRAALPRMNPSLRAIAEKILAQEEKK